jgi:hypothetical protein
MTSLVRVDGSWISSMVESVGNGTLLSRVGVLMHGSRGTRDLAVETCQSTSTRPSGDAGTQCIGSTSVGLAATMAGHMVEAQRARSEWIRMAV